MTDVHAKMGSRHYARLTELEQEDRLTPERVLEDARSERSPLHELYDWDIDRAAKAHWLGRSREILQAFRVIRTVRTETYAIPNYVRDPDRQSNEQGYVSMRALQADGMLARRVLIAECARIAGHVTRARGIALAVGMESDFEELLRKVVRLRERLEAEEQKAEKHERATVS